MNSETLTGPFTRYELRSPSGNVYGIYEAGSDLEKRARIQSVDLNEMLNGPNPSEWLIPNADIPTLNNGNRVQFYFTPEGNEKFVKELLEILLQSAHPNTTLLKTEIAELPSSDVIYQDRYQIVIPYQNIEINPAIDSLDTARIIASKIEMASILDK